MNGLIQTVCWIILIFCLTSCKENINPPEVTDQEFFIDENSKTGTIVGVVIAYDLDEGQSVSFEIADGNEKGTFEIDPIGGHISVVDPTELDYELQTRMVLSILAADDHPRDPKESIAAITINLNDLNEFAPVMEDQTFELVESPTKGDTVGIIEANDPEIHQQLHFTVVSGNKGNIFTLDAETGVLMVNDPVGFDSDINQQLLLIVKVRDIHLDSKTDTAQISIVLNYAKKSSKSR